MATSTPTSVFNCAITKAMAAAKQARSYGEAQMIFMQIVKEVLRDNRDNELANLILQVAGLATAREEDQITWLLTDDTPDGSLRPVNVDEWYEFISMEVDHRHNSRQRRLANARIRNRLTRIREILG